MNTLWELFNRWQHLWNMPVMLKSDADKAEQAFLGFLFIALLCACVAMIVMGYMLTRKLYRKYAK